MHYKDKEISNLLSYESLPKFSSELNGFFFYFHYLINSEKVLLVIYPSQIPNFGDSNVFYEHKLGELQFKPIFLFFYFPIANKLGDTLGKRSLRMGKANIGYIWLSEKNLRLKSFLFYFILFYFILFYFIFYLFIYFFFFVCVCVCV